MNDTQRPFKPLNICVLTVSDSRTLAEDTSGQALADALTQAGHHLYDRQLVADDIYQIRKVASAWIADDKVDVVLTTGGTGLTGRDGTPEAISPLFDKTINGFGEMFRMVSWNNIHTSTLQSRAVAGVANRTYLFVLPGSSGAVRDAWNEIIRHQLDYRTRPCNLVELMPRLNEQ